MNSLALKRCPCGLTCGTDAGSNHLSQEAVVGSRSPPDKSVSWPTPLGQVTYQIALHP